MSAFFPGSLLILVISAVTGGALIGLGYLLNRFGMAPGARTIAWLGVTVGFISMNFATNPAPAGFRMLALASELLYGMKGVVAVESRRRGRPPLSPLRWFCFCALWFGMRPGVFAKLFTRPPLPGARALAISGLVRIALGAAFVALARWIAAPAPDPGPKTFGALALLMIGLSLIVHFGLFDLLAGIYRFGGADCAKLFRAPLLSLSLTEFWSRRWNIAFSEMTAIAIYWPLKRRLPPETARTLAFLFSGLVHELAISVPARTGYGLPFCYFLLHAAALRLEAAGPVRRGLQSRALAPLWTVGWVLIPLPLLFHRGFCSKVLLPLLF